MNEHDERKEHSIFLRDMLCRTLWDANKFADIPHWNILPICPCLRPLKRYRKIPAKYIGHDNIVLLVDVCYCVIASLAIAITQFGL